jgi:hypothetical protein
MATLSLIIKNLDEGIIGDALGKIGGALKKKLKGLFGGDDGIKIEDKSPDQSEKDAAAALQQLYFSYFFAEVDGGNDESKSQERAKNFFKKFVGEMVEKYEKTDLTKNSDDKEEEK